MALQRSTMAITVAAALALLSCDGDDEDVGTPAEPTDASPSEPTADLDGDRPEDLELVVAFEGLDLPVDIDPVPNQPGRYLVAEQSGRIKLVEEGVAGEHVVVADLSDQIDLSASEEGLLGLAFAPGFSAAELGGRLFIYYTAPAPGRGVLSRLTFDGVALGDEEVLLEIPQPEVQHNGGGLAFGPDGHLYLALGDGGPPGSGNEEAQNLGNLLGKIIRIDVSSGEGYEVPADNPFVNDEDVLEEIFAYGFRNPWRISFDRETGLLWAADPGASTYEEINIVLPGANYGWRIKEGPGCYEADACDDEGLVDPVTGYPAQDGCAIIGGAVYRGGAIERLQGWYVYANYCQNAPATLFAALADDTSQTMVLLEDLPVIVSFAEDENGELLLLSFDGRVFRLEPS